MKVKKTKEDRIARICIFSVWVAVLQFAIKFLFIDPFVAEYSLTKSVSNLLDVLLFLLVVPSLYTYYLIFRYVSKTLKMKED